RLRVRADQSPLVIARPGALIAPAPSMTTARVSRAVVFGAGIRDSGFGIGDLSMCDVLAWLGFFVGAASAATRSRMGRG
ncbi:hypothetical protein, partial [Pantoea dispersa]|uniref:hypothetical protein n=1 Tax=Pantoea dispersa TaxID=59814 RepID=UPI001C6597F7